MDLSLKENSVLGTLTKVFNSYVFREKKDNPEFKSLTKNSIFQLFFDYNIMDTCGYNILHINEFLHQLVPDDNEEVTFEKFLILVFYIYETQIQPKFDEENEVSDLTIENINDISDNRQEISEGENIIKIILEDYENGKKYFKFCNFTEDTMSTQKTKNQLNIYKEFLTFFSIKVIYFISTLLILSFKYCLIFDIICGLNCDSKMGSVIISVIYL